MKIKASILGIVESPLEEDNNYSMTIEDLTPKKVKLPIVLSKNSGSIVYNYINGDKSVLEDTLIGNLVANLKSEITEVYINKITNGTFTTELSLGNGTKFEGQLVDAIFVHLLTDCDIYVSKDIMVDNGVILNEDNEVLDGEIVYEEEDYNGNIKKDDNITSLSEKLEEALENENYEEASQIRDKIKLIKENNSDK